MSKGSLFTLVIINTYIPIFWKEPRVKVRPLRRYSPEKMPWLWSAIETSVILVWNFERGLFIAIERWSKGTAGTIRKTRSSSKIIWERICGGLRDSICANARATEGIRAWNARINCLETFAIVRDWESTKSLTAPRSYLVTEMEADPIILADVLQSVLESQTWSI